MKRLLLLSALALFLSTTSWAYDFTAKNDDGKTISYNITSSSERTCEVTYYSSSYAYYSGTINIPSKVNYNNTTYIVTSIGYDAFCGCSSLKSVTIPESVTEIGSYAFLGCSGLTEIILPESVTSIGSEAFWHCTGLTEVNFNAIACTYAGSSTSNSAFYGCSNISMVNIGKDVTIIPDYLCCGRSGLTSITIPNSVTSIGDYAFYGCKGLTEVTIPDNVTRIRDYTFSSCSSLTQVTIGNSVTSIGSYAFANSGLESIAIPSSVTTIGADAFDTCESLTSVVIGESVASIGDYAFWFCTNLSDVTVLNPEPPSCSSYTFGYVDTNACSLTVPKGSKGAYSTADVWKDFYNIVEIDVSPVENILTSGKAVVTGYYTLDGKQISTPQRGVNIIRYSDGSIRKVLVK